MIIREKQTLRVQMKNILRAFSGRAEASGRLAEHLRKLDAWRRARVIYAYSPLPSEPDWRQPGDEEKIVAYPQVEGDDMNFYQALTWQVGPLGNLEPAEKQPAPNPDLILVPGLAFTPQGHRLGRGRGFYDRWLEGETNAFTLGLCFECQIVPELPREGHDQAVRAVLTEETFRIAT